MTAFNLIFEACQAGSAETSNSRVLVVCVGSSKEAYFCFCDGQMLSMLF